MLRGFHRQDEHAADRGMEETMPSIECCCLIVERMGDDPAGTDDLCSCHAPSHGVGDEVGTQALALMLLVDGKAAKQDQR